MSNTSITHIKLVTTLVLHIIISSINGEQYNLEIAGITSNHSFTKTQVDKRGIEKALREFERMKYIIQERIFTTIVDGLGK